MLGTDRQISTVVSSVSGAVAGLPTGSTSRTFAGSGSVMRMRPSSDERREVARAVAVDAEVVSVDWTEQRVIGSRIDETRVPEGLELRERSLGRQLESIFGDVAGGAGTAVRPETGERLIEKVRPAAALGGVDERGRRGAAVR